MTKYFKSLEETYKKASNYKISKETKDYAELKAENEELKKFHINLVGVKECEIKELIKYKQALAEIKEIAEEYQKEYLVNNGVFLLCNQILQKISEVVDEI